jgi:hypothetical protein
MDNSSPSGLFSDTPFYSAHFMDLTWWEPYVRLVCNRHGFGCERVIPGLPGSFPTFIVGLDAQDGKQTHQSVVVKFFGSLFDGADSFRIERCCGYWWRQHSMPIPSPGILAEGQLDPDWYYLIFEHVPGVSIGLVRNQLSQDDWLSVARQMGEYARRLHALTAGCLPELLPTIKPAWDEYASFLLSQRSQCLANHRAWNDLPVHLLDQLEDFVLPVEHLINFSAPPHLIHADLTADHLLGRLAPSDPASAMPATKEWHSLAIIDWGDAMIGNILYELVALHLDLFQANKHLLHTCLEVYGLPDFFQHDFPRKALSMVLLHQFPVHSRVYAPHQDAQTLQELAERLFGT